MAFLPLLPQGTLDFTGLSRPDMLVRLQTLFNQVNPEWDDYSASYPENLILEGAVFNVDIIRGVMEERVRQLSWATVVERLSAIRLGRGTGFQLTGATAAQVTGTFSLATGTAAVQITIPEGTRVRTRDPEDPRKYRTTVEGIITVGQSSVDIVMEQAELIEETFESEDDPNLELILDGSPLIEGSLEVTATNGSYTELSTFLSAVATTRGHVTLVDDEGVGRVRFGNGINGSIPSGTISVSYKVGGGVSGEVDAGAKWIVEDSLNNDDGDPVSLLLTNAEASSPAYDAMTVEEARVRGPLSARTQKRSVIEGDFEYVATSVGGVARALMATVDDDPAIAEDHGRLEIVALGTRLDSGRYAAAAPTAAQLAAVVTALDDAGTVPPLMGFTYDVAAASLVTVNAEVRVYKRSSFTAADVATNVRNAFADFFAVADEYRAPTTTVDFGVRLVGSDGLPDYLVLWSAVLDAVLAASGVRYVGATTDNLLLNGVHGSVRLLPRQFPILGTVSVFDEDQGGVQI